MVKKGWWIKFPRFKCPHCSKVIQNIEFKGRFKLPRVRKDKRGESIIEREDSIPEAEDSEET
jgi:hypothetical protein